ncbi:phage tail length tape measure family protein, partial [Xanthobacteraceae bacterium Astr-EGSB]|uniref:phage tail length tape measure family protein n=1 Tax=Astrobacterium formosum TaxID=3069710 RepID=UPI0027B198EE|nr:phage tail length tape measure family protein [Xanthobacteraceae bacterium Astr-EGSB]
MATAAPVVQPIVLAGEYRADGAFRALSRDITTAKTLGSQAKTEMVSLSSAFNSLSLQSARSGTAVMGIGRSAGSSAQLMQGLSFQINDVVSGLAMGQSPFMIMTQQGGQVYQVLSMHQGGVGGALSEIKERLLGLVTPGRVAFLAFSALAGAAYLIYRAVREEQPTLEASLKEQARLVGLVKDAYRDAKDKAGEFNTEVKSAVVLQAKANLQQLQAQLRTLGRGAVSDMTTPTAVPGDWTVAHMPEMAAGRATSSKYREFRAAVDELSASVDKGEPKIEAFREAVANLGLANPALQKTALELLKSTDGAQELAAKIKEAQAALNLLSGTGDDKDRKSLGLTVDDKKTAVAKRSYEDLKARTRDRIDELKLEAQAYDFTGEAVTRLKLTHDLERAAKKDGLAVDAAKRKEIEGLADAYIRVNTAAAAARLKSDILFDRSQLGMTSGEAQIAQTLRSAQIDPSSAQGEYLAKQLRINQALTETKDLASDALKGFIADLKSGKSEGEAFANVLTKIADRALSFGIDKGLSWLFSGFGGGTGGVLPGGLPLGQGGIGHNASGTDNWRGGLTWVGESGRELVNLPKGSEIIPLSKMSRQGGGTVINYSPVIDARGAEAGAVARVER